MWSNNIQRFIKKFNMRLIALILIVSCYAALEIYFFIGLLYEMSQNNIDYEIIVTYLFLLLAIPLYILLGAHIANSNKQISFIYFWIPLIYGSLFSVIAIKLWNIWNQTKYFRSIARLIGISPLIITLIWLTVGYFRSERRQQKMIVMIFSCYFFALPLGVLLTLNDTSDNFDATVSVVVLLSIGVTPLILLILYYTIVIVIYLIQLPKQFERFNFKAYIYINLTNYAYWINALGFIIGFYFLCYYAQNEPKTATGTKKGTIIGLLVIHTVLFILINKALSVEVLDQQIETSKLYLRQIDRLKKSIILGTLFPFIILLPIALTRKSETSKNAFLSCAIGIPLSFQYFKFLMYVRSEATIYQNFFLPLIVVLSWIFVLGPIGILFPLLADNYKNTSQEFIIFAQLGVAYTILVGILGVTCKSIFYSVLLNKEYLEMKKREVLKVVMQLLANNRVFSTEEICSLIFFRYIQENDSCKLTQQLKEGDPTNVVEYSGQVNFDQLLVSKPDYENRKKLERLARRNRGSIVSNTLVKSDIYSTKASLRRSSIFFDAQHQIGCIEKVQDYIFKCIFCTFGNDELDEMVDSEQKKEVELTELEQWKESQLHKERLKMPDLNFSKKLQRDDFYCSLKLRKERTERFWVCIYQKFSKNLSLILDYLDFIRDDEILSQYTSFNIDESGFLQLSLADFARLMKDNAPENEQSCNDYLWSLALRKYPLFIFNFPELRSLLKIQVKDTPFQYSSLQTKVVYDADQENSGRKKLAKVESQLNEYIEKKYQSKKEIINKKYKIMAPSDFKLKLYVFCQCLHETLWDKPIKVTEKLMRKITNSLSYKIPLPQPEVGRINKNIKWEIIAEQVSACVVEQCKLFDIQMKNIEYKFSFTTTNILAIVIRFNDLFGLATLAFSPQVGWFGENQQFNPIKIVDYSVLWSEYNLFFFLGLIMSFAYIFLGAEAIKQIENNTFGFDETGQIATFKSKRFWLSKVISFISGQFIFVMKTYIDAFICDYSQYPYTLVRSPSVECMSDMHFMYVVLAIVGCGIYYPLSTFLQPTFQFSDNSLDLKYKSTYVVLYIQAKLLILGLGSVFSNLQQQAYMFQMLFSSFVTLMLIYSYYKIWPSYVKWFNKIELCSMLILFYIYFGAFLIMASNNYLSGWIFLASLSLITIGLLIYQMYKSHQKDKISQLAQIVPINSAESSQIQQNQE